MWIRKSWRVLPRKNQVSKGSGSGVLSTRCGWALDMHQSPGWNQRQTQGSLPNQSPEPPNKVRSTGPFSHRQDPYCQKREQNPPSPQPPPSPLTLRTDTLPLIQAGHIEGENARDSLCTNFRLETQNPFHHSSGRQPLLPPGPLLPMLTLYRERRAKGSQAAGTAAHPQRTTVWNFRDPLKGPAGPAH